VTFSITVDQSAWFSHHAAVFQKYQQQQQLIAVIKSNGYGLTQANLAKVAAHHGLERVAVGTVYEVNDVAANFTGEIVVLEPLNPADEQALKIWKQVLSGKDRNRIIATLATYPNINQTLKMFPDIKWVLELQTQMNRFGVSAILRQEMINFNGNRSAGLLGITSHFPFHPKGNDVSAVLSFAERNKIKDVAVSHISSSDLQKYSKAFPDLNLRMRIGSELWLGNRKAIRATGTVLAVHTPESAQKVGYHQTKTRKSYIVISGGTAHGIGLAAPSPNRTPKQRLNAVGIGALQAIGKSLSPFIVNGKKAWFVEPPHQHVSIVYGDFNKDIVGTQIEVDVRFTTTKADVVLGIDL
jgi:alanine racemase